MPESDAFPSTVSASAALKDLVDRAREFGSEPVRLARGERILKEGTRNTTLYVLLEGNVHLSKTGADGQKRILDELGPGSLIGILSFWTGKASFSDTTATTDVECLGIERESFERAVSGDPAFARLTLQLLVANLSDRYRRVVGLNLEVAGLTRELEHERNALQSVVADLKRTRNQMVHREKLATMGQLLAGIAHEINNPSSSLLKSVDQLARELPGLFRDRPEELQCFEEGRRADYVGASESRERMERLQAEYPFLNRSLCRRLSRLTPGAFQLLAPDLARRDLETVDEKVRVFEIGNALHSIRVADERITRLVKGLKSYSRQEDGEDAQVRLERCIQDTLMVLNHRLKHYDFRLDVPELPEIPGRAGEINQILTNLLTNACEATPKGGRIDLRAGVSTDRATVWVEVADTGHGIPAELMDRIFEPNVTTKSGGGQFGLGLGLAISRDLAMQHQGRLTAESPPEGGARFRLELPAR